LQPTVKHFQKVSEPQWELPGPEVCDFSMNYASLQLAAALASALFYKAITMTDVSLFTSLQDQEKLFNNSSYELS